MYAIVHQIRNHLQTTARSMRVFVSTAITKNTKPKLCVGADVKFLA